MKRILSLAAFVVVSIILVENAPAPPLPEPTAAPVGSFLTDGMAVGLMLAYGLWRMRK